MSKPTTKQRAAEAIASEALDAIIYGRDFSRWLAAVARSIQLDARTAAQALHDATDPTASAFERIAAMPAWQAAAERLAIALVSHLESFEETADDRAH